MGETLVGLLCFFISMAALLAVVAVVGHGLWLMAAAFFSRGEPSPIERNERKRPRVCVGCGEDFFDVDGRCATCGLDPHSDAADELKDLIAAARTVQKLRDLGRVTTDDSEQIYKSIETRQAELLPRRHATAWDKDEPQTDVELLEAWFGEDLGKGMSVEEKRKAMAMIRSMPVRELRELSGRALAGAAKLQLSVGMLSRACEVYDVLFDWHPKSAITLASAADALRAAHKLGDWARAREYARVVSAMPGWLARHPEVETLIREADKRVGEIPKAQPVAAAPVIAEPIKPPVKPTRTLPPPVPAPLHVEPAPAVHVEPPPPPAPRRSFAEWIAVFMEERNIMWGEIIGGSLIVGCSIALVISLWSTLQDQIPIFPFIIFAVITTSLFAAGLYTLHHWKLESTSRGLLVIGTLLVPLNFLVLAGLSLEVQAGIWEYLTEFTTLAVFGWCLYRSSKVLMEAPLDLPSPIALPVTAAMLVSVGSLLFAPRWLADAQTGTAFHYVLTLLPVLAMAGAIGWILFRLGKLESLNPKRAVTLLVALGSLTFACGVNLSFPLWLAKRDAVDLTGVLVHLSPALTLLGVPILIAGTLIHKKLDAESEHRGLLLTLGTGLGLLGLVVMFGGFVVAVDSLAHRWLCGLINLGTLVATAWVLRVPVLQIAAQLYLAVLVVFGWSVDIDWMDHSIMAARLIGLLVFQTLTAEMWMRLGRRTDGKIYAIGASVTTALACVLALINAPDHGEITTQVLGVAALTWLATNLRWRMAEITYGTAVAFAGAIFFGYQHYAALWMPSFQEQLLWSVLTHATICLAGSVALRRVSLEWVAKSYRVPLMLASLAATFVVAGTLAVEQARFELSWTVGAMGCGWLAALWLTLAVLEGWPILFGAFQIALSFTWFFAASEWLTANGWEWLEPYSVYVYAIGIAGQSLVWELLRIGLRSRPQAAALLTPVFVPIDRILSEGLLVGQYVLTVLAILGSIGVELSQTPDAWRVFPANWHDRAFSLPAWMLLVVLAGVLIIWMREFDLQLPALGFTLLLLTVPLLVAGTWFAEEKAAASATRWGLAIVYGLAGLFLWNRNRLGLERAGRVPAMAMRVLLFAGAVVPALLITLNVAVQKLNGVDLPGPIAGSIFHAMKRPVSLLIPLALFSAAFAVHGFRERRAYYLSGSGLLTTAACVGGFFLVLQRMEIPFSEPWVPVDALLVAAATASLWSIAWAWIAAMLEDGESKPLLDSVLLTLNSCLGVACYGIVLVTAITTIVSTLDGRSHPWVLETGSIWSRLAFGVVALGAGYVIWQRRQSVPLHLPGLIGIAAVGLIACMVQNGMEGHGHIALMFGSGVFACAWVALMFCFDPRQLPRWLTSTSRLWEAVIYSAGPAAFAVMLGSAALVSGLERIWSAEAVILAAAACGLLAYQRKTDIWASMASLILMPASTLLVVHFFDGANPELWLRVIQVDLAVLGGAALARLALHRYLSATPEAYPLASQLGAQILIGMLANVALLGIGSLALVFSPDQPDRWLQLHGDASGWLALATNAIAAVWFLGRARPNAVVHAVAISGVLFGITLAASADLVFKGEIPWLAHHVLTLTWTLLGMALLIVSWGSHANDALGPQFWPSEYRMRLADFLRRCFPQMSARGWVTVIGVYVVMLSLRATWVEPERPFWSVGNTLAVSVLLGALAIWARAPIFVYGSGLLFNVIGLMLFTAWDANRANLPGPILGEDARISYFFLAQILSFAFAALIWSVIERRLHGGEMDVIKRNALPFSQVALALGIYLMAIGVVLANVLHLIGDEMEVRTGLAWVALVVLAAGSIHEWWRPALRRFTRFHLYTCGLTALGTLLYAMSQTIVGWNISDWYPVAAVLLAAYTLLIVVLRRLIDAHETLREWHGIGDETSGAWFWQMQLLNLGLVAAASIWITLTYPKLEGRLAATLASGLVGVSMFLLVKPWPKLFADDQAATAPKPRYAVMALGFIVALEAGWALLGQDVHALSMHRISLAFTLSVAALFVLRFAWPRFLGETAWAEPGRRMAAGFGVASVVLLLAMLGLEFVNYDLTLKQTPHLLALSVPSCLALVALTALTAYSALARSHDLYGIEGERRSLYVYFAEVLVLALVAHLRLNVPKLMPAAIGQYWYLTVMVLAFGGLALGEWLTRKALPILAVPLKRSAMLLAFVPVTAFMLAYFVKPDAESLAPLRQSIPGVVPFLDYMNAMWQNYAMHALCWLLLGIFFAWQARLRSSANFGVFAALAVNFGVWVILGHQDMTTFLERPQLWLIPLGLIILVAEYVNRERLGFWPSMGVRYAGLMCIYLSSTFEMFREGLGNVAFAIILALLAVVGMMLGILLRVRAILLTGFMALLMVIFAQIWNAAVINNHMWVWWASGIVLGLVILVLFALFEKKRNDVIKVIDNMKRWH